MTVLFSLLVAASFAVAGEEPGPDFQSLFRSVQPLCDEYFLPTQWRVRQTSISPGILRGIERQLNEQASVFRSAQGIAYLMAQVGSSDDVSQACARTLLEYASATPANLPLQPTRATGPHGQREAAGSGPRG